MYDTTVGFYPSPDLIHRHERLTSVAALATFQVSLLPTGRCTTARARSQPTATTGRAGVAAAESGVVGHRLASVNGLNGNRCWPCKLLDRSNISAGSVGSNVAGTGRPCLTNSRRLAAFMRSKSSGVQNGRRVWRGRFMAAPSVAWPVSSRRSPASVVMLLADRRSNTVGGPSHPTNNRIAGTSHNRSALARHPIRSGRQVANRGR